MMKQKQVVFWNSLAFSMVQQMLAILFLVPLPFLNLAWISGSSRFMYWWSLSWRILSITWLACEIVQLCSSLSILRHLLFFGMGMETDLFQSWGHCWVFQICWYIECNTFTTSSFRIWNSSAGIPSPSLVLFAVILLKTTWLHTPGCLTLGEWSHRLGYLGH